MTLPQKYISGLASQVYLLIKHSITEMASKVHILINRESLAYPVSVLGREEGFTVKYNPLPEGVPEGKARGNS